MQQNLKRFELEVVVAVVEDRLVPTEWAVIPGMGDILSGEVIRFIQGPTIMVVEATEAEAIHLHTHHVRFIPKAFQPAPTHTTIVDRVAVVMDHQVEDNRHLAMEGMFGEHHRQGAGLQMGMVATQLVPTMVHMEVVGMVIMVDRVPRHTLRVARHPVDEGGVGNDMLCLL